MDLHSIRSTRRWMITACLSIFLAAPSISLARTTNGAALLRAGGFQDDGVIKGVRVYGATRFSPYEVLRASGLRIGEDLTDAALRRSQQRLADTGAFTDIGADDFPGMGGVVLHFNLRDMQPLATCDFSRIPGIDQKRLLAELTAAVPLFDGRVPLANPRMLNTVRIHLAAILKRHGITGKVDDAIQFPASGSGPARVEFHLRTQAGSTP